MTNKKNKNKDAYARLGFYTPIDIAKNEIRRRWGNFELKNKVEKFLEGNIPHVLSKEPRAISTIQIASPNIAFKRFTEESKEVDLRPLVFEYQKDLFVTTNYDKACLAKMIFYHGRQDNGEMITTNEKVIDLSGKEEKRQFKEIETIWGENFVDFHHRLTDKAHPGIEFYDGSDWYKASGGKPDLYYKKTMALLICHGILFENFLLDNKEGDFTRDIIFPAFTWAREYFGVSPLIVPVLPMDEQEDRYWWCYPEYIKTYFKE